MTIGNCRFCGDSLQHTFVDLGMSPLSNAFLSKAHLHCAEKFYPLHAYVCQNCFLVQLEQFEPPEHIFKDYAYFSSYSDSWLNHAKAYTDMMIDRFELDQSSQVIEIASNDGYLLQYFQEKGIPILGIEPAANVAQVAEAKGVPTLVKFFNTATAKELVAKGKQADLLLGNNVLAHVPNLNDFIFGMKLLLKESGILTMEFPHLLQLIQQNQFDTIYHEHCSYLSFSTLEKIFSSHQLTLFDVEKLWTHGGSLRIYAKHSSEAVTASDRVIQLKSEELQAGLDQIETYLEFGKKVQLVKRELLTFLIHARDQGRVVVAYGAAAKGNTLLNFCGIRTDFIDYVVDRNPHKQGLFLPGTHIPIYSPDQIRETQPDYLLILPWNFKEEIMQQQSYIREWGGKFVIPIPQLEVIG